MARLPSVTSKRTLRLSPRTRLPGATSPPRRMRVPGATCFSTTSVGELKNTIESFSALSTSAAATHEHRARRSDQGQASLLARHRMPIRRCPIALAPSSIRRSLSGASLSARRRIVGGSCAPCRGRRAPYRRASAAASRRRRSRPAAAASASRSTMPRTICVALGSAASWLAAATSSALGPRAGGAALVVDPRQRLAHESPAMAHPRRASINARQICAASVRRPSCSAARPR